MFFYMLVYERPYITSTHKKLDFYRECANQNCGLQLRVRRPPFGNFIRAPVVTLKKSHALRIAANKDNIPYSISWISPTRTVDFDRLRTIDKQSRTDCP